MGELGRLWEIAISSPLHSLPIYFQLNRLICIVFCKRYLEYDIQTESEIDLHRDYLSEMNVFLIISLRQYYRSPKKCAQYRVCDEV